MQFLADENVKRKLVVLLSEAGHDIRYASKRLTNSSLALLARKEKRILITHDTDFANIDLYPPEKFAGIIVLSIHPPTLARLIAALEKLLKKVPAGEFAGKLFVLREDGVEVIEK